MDITQLILDDHHEQRRLFATLEEIDPTDTERLKAVWARLAAFLETHAEAEERLAAAAPLPRRDWRGRREGICASAAALGGNLLVAGDGQHVGNAALL